MAEGSGVAQHILSLSYGKDSLACLAAIEQLGWPLDGIVHAEVWATDDIPADLPPMVEFKKKADEIIKERWGIEVEHVCALRPAGSQNLHVERQDGVSEPTTSDSMRRIAIPAQSCITQDGQTRYTVSPQEESCGATANSKLPPSMPREKQTYEKIFYSVTGPETKRPGQIYGYPFQKGPWCNSRLKMRSFLRRGTGTVTWCNTSA